MYLIINQVSNKLINKYIPKEITNIIKKKIQKEIINFNILKFNFYKFKISYPLGVAIRMKSKKYLNVYNAIKLKRDYKKLIEIIQMTNYFIDLKPSVIKDLQHYCKLLDENYNDFTCTYPIIDNIIDNNYCDCIRCKRKNKYPIDIFEMMYYI